MSSQGIQSNESSVLLTSYVKAGLNDYSYTDSVSDPLVVRQNYTVAPMQASSGVPAGQVIRFNIPRGGYLTNAEIKTTFTTAGTLTSLSYNAGLSVFQSIEIQANSKTLVRMDAAAIKARAMTERAFKKEAILRRAIPLDPTTELAAAAAPGTFVVYTPLFSSFFENLKSNADLGFDEQLQVVATFYSAYQSLGTGVGADFTGATNELVCYTNTYTSDYMNQLRAPYASGNVNQLSYNYVYQPTSITGTPTEWTAQLRTNSPVRRMFVAVITDAGLYKRINSAQFQYSGAVLIQDAKRNQINYDAEFRGTSQNVLTATAGATVSALVRNDIGWVTFDFCNDPLDFSYVSGGLSFNNLSAPTITVKTETLASTDTLVVVYEALTVLTIDQRGVMNISQFQ